MPNACVWCYVSPGSWFPRQVVDVEPSSLKWLNLKPSPGSATQVTGLYRQPPGQLYHAVGWSDLALNWNFLNLVQCCRSGLFLQVQFQKIGEFGRVRRTRGKVFIFFKSGFSIFFQKAKIKKQTSNQNMLIYDIQI